MHHNKTDPFIGVMGAYMAAADRKPGKSLHLNIGGKTYAITRLKKKKENLLSH